ncbi:aminotransferase class V-fold PLP-dependent enzyme [Streptomyces sp. B1866]|uniref:aminotransferase class V-fold PLP-dependent enzyme n=1 Tax=Streptomyces sp. B1866 TaxID=3075431 RepID=UPI00288C9360|nr:aminotransferase class V-fold PLP-dependent enzyme [Streptomyces sp. B1866]MDT3400334.1 aminotransferase class V-fold PLP-dependent enzyme [Streptomyces sp. B1866]
MSGDARKKTGPSYPPLYTPFKLASGWLVPKLRDSRLSSNAVTVAWVILLVVASVALAAGRQVLAGSLVLVAILFDCVDGDLARSRNRPSVSGTLLEQLAHWIGNMSLIAGAGAALLLAHPQAGNVALVSALTVVQAVYIAVVRQIRPDAANILEHPRLRRTFRRVVRVLWLLSPIELPIMAVLIAFGTSAGVLRTLVIVLTLSGSLIFVPHFLLIRAVDRRKWTQPAEATPTPERTGAATPRLLEVDWWVPGTPHLPGEVRALLGGQPVAAGTPFVSTARQELDRTLPALFRTTGRVLPLACPEELALEAVVGALGRLGDRFLIAGGRSAVRRWRRVVERLGMKIAVSEAVFGAGLNSTTLAERLAQGPPPRFILLAMADPADGTLTDLPAVLRVLQDVPTTVIADATLSFCADDLRMDEWGVDVAMSSSASGVMAPPGLSLIALGPRALAALEKVAPARLGGYLDLRAHLGNRPPTPPSAALLGLQLSVSLIQDSGLDSHIAQRRASAERFRRRCAEQADLTPIADLRSASCTAFVLPGDVRLSQLQANLFTLSRVVVGHGRTPGGMTTLNVGHSGRRGAHDMDQAAAALADALRMSRDAVSA